MKKLSILIPGLMVAAVTPAFAMTACGEKTRPVRKVWVESGKGDRDTIRYSIEKQGVFFLVLRSTKPFIFF